ncbi:phytoene/squalene synthase family protein [Pseudobacter ginsenosidimutans]|uniref:Phytoene/squalene synthetase n=1 Tax=Pseudobacter ginsenosidimutans TaxID=661488 RepID=A0A4Q7MUA1_9BACT|nr:phytoene/squalene synthase family protein [Pseudobacter ginsenosidimutans]QEC41023.1 phytoene/squalene synthase family protein [Pseudobacter ginsenosidimutans]RZS72227.1 phytoene/squalene synthetase [Pseudobacter ginsenosidimutans]
MMHLFHHVSHRCSKATAETYSTSFAAAIRLLHKDLRVPVYSIYGFVRFADEIVDSFHHYDKAALLQEFEEDTWKSIQQGISLNPILQSFQQAVNRHQIDHSLIRAFFQSMAMDLTRSRHEQQSYTEYIYGSAEVVGLMCLTVFCEGDTKLFLQLKPYAQSLGAAFQKVNFLRDMRADQQQLQRIYFPGISTLNWNESSKQEIEKDIEMDFEQAYKGVMLLPLKARFGVYVAYRYYWSLFRKIRRSTPAAIMEKRIRIPNYHKAMILVGARFSQVLQ